ncbi:hypothetical protein B0H14DRAFT_2597631 [Mycena olivaceomarginata]|nr:hypothetical protein B0H14DRAFT_2597631 [Mycena olivaceomarginata]
MIHARAGPRKAAAQYRVTGLMLTKAEDLAQQWADSLGNAETQLNERNIELKNAQDQLVLYRQAVKPHQDHGQVLQDEEDIMASQQLQTADEDLHAKFVNLEQEQHQTLKANKILEVEVAKKKQETVMNLAEQVKKLNAELERAYQDIKYQNGLQAQKNNEIEELQSQLVTGPKAPSFAEESAIAKMQKDLDILEEQLAMTIHNKNDKTMQELTITLAIFSIGHAVLQRRLADSYHQLHQLEQKHDELQNRWDIQKLVLLQKHNELQNKWDVQRSILSLSSREQERHKAYQELEGRNAQMEAQNQQIQTNLNDQTGQLHELQQKHNELQNKWDVQRSVLSLSSREQERHKAYQELEGRNAQMEAQNQQIQTNLNDPQQRLNLTSLYHQLMLYLDKILSKPTVNFFPAGICTIGGLECVKVSCGIYRKMWWDLEEHRLEGVGQSHAYRLRSKFVCQGDYKQRIATKSRENVQGANSIEVWTENGWIVLMSKIVALRMDICRVPSGMGARDRLDRMNVFTEERRELHRRGDGWGNSEWGGRFTQRVGSNDKKTVRFMSRQRMKHTEDPDQGRGHRTAKRGGGSGAWEETQKSVGSSLQTRDSKECGGLQSEQASG